MKYLIQTCTIVILIGILGITSIAKAKEPERHVLLKQLIDKKNLTVHYLGKSYGMDGWVLKDENKKDKENGAIQYVYTTPEGGMILGLLFGSDGSIETMKQIRSLKGKITEGKDVSAEKTPDVITEVKSEEPVKSTALENYRKEKAKTASELKHKLQSSSNSKSEKFYRAAESSNWVSIGSDNAAYIYVFINPACEHCKNYWQDLTPSIENGNIQVRVIPFGRVEINRNAGAAMLSVSNPGAAWSAYAMGDISSLDVKLATPEAFRKLDFNTSIWTKWQLPMPPFTVYRSPEDGSVKVIAGRPDNTLLLLSEIIE